MWIGGEVRSSDSNRTQTVEETNRSRGVWIGNARLTVDGARTGMKEKVDSLSLSRGEWSQLSLEKVCDVCECV